MGVLISKFIIGLILVGLITAGIGIFMSGLSSEYGVSYDNSTIDVYNDLDTINNLTEELESGTLKDSGAKSGLTDIVGAFMQDAYSVLTITFKSMTTFKTMTDASVENANLGGGGFPKIVRTAIISIVIILIVIGVIVSAWLRRDM